ncbi:hypothetical protein HPB51_028635 [Rhipicephalus microplus]|uniref:Uncharacterized protein n=1 Tax=Rhipicephalus microplus TaxID=6941 RepID=A0A9J6CWT6_RHIMP|nr:hypothetical protein HPB51_028635 [Rhipicephalus microplus]
MAQSEGQESTASTSRQSTLATSRPHYMEPRLFVGMAGEDVDTWLTHYKRTSAKSEIRGHVVNHSRPTNDMANAFGMAPPHRGGQPPLSKLATDPSQLSGLSIGSASVPYQSAATVASKDTLPATLTDNPMTEKVKATISLSAVGDETLEVHKNFIFAKSGLKADYQSPVKKMFDLRTEVGFAILGH